MDGSGTLRELTAAWCGVANSLRMESASEAARRPRNAGRAVPLTFSHHIQSARHAVEFSRAAHKQRRDPVTATPEQRRLSAVTLGNFHRIWWLYPNADSSEQGFDPDSGGGY
jgi:hypothetical protein